LNINYHPGKANVVADALSRKSYCNLLELQEQRPELYKEFAKLNLGFVSNTKVVAMEVEATFEQDIRKGQLNDEKITEIKELTKEDKAPGFVVDEQGVLWFKGEFVFQT
jgi:hypothetical protein